MKKKRLVIPHPTDPSLALVPLTQGFFATISIVDAAACGESNWSTWSRDRYVYAARHVGTKKNAEGLHRFIASRMGILATGLLVDHINGNGLDCRRSNLRAATQGQNRHNSVGHSKSGVKGVYRNGGKWLARMRIDGKLVSLGTFSSLEEASSVVRIAREKVHHEFANHGVRH